MLHRADVDVGPSSDHLGYSSEETRERKRTACCFLAAARALEEKGGMATLRRGDPTLAATATG
tara:strand:- start:455 stop:643 length:189 start_codon:yes stop_codon:yes gene_type:complete